MTARLWLGGASVIIGLYISVGALWAWLAPGAVGTDTLIVQRAAVRLVHGQPIYTDPDGSRFIEGGLDLFYGPPALVVAALPLGLATEEAIRHLAFPVAWLLIGIALALVTRPLKLGGAELAALAIGTVLSYAVFGMATLGASSVLVLIALAATWWCLERGHGVGAAICLGTAVAMRIYPGALILALLAARRYRIAAQCVLVTGLWWGAGLIIAGPDATQTYVRLLVTIGGSDTSTSNTSLAAIVVQTHGPIFLSGAARIASIVGGIALLITGGRVMRGGGDAARRLLGWGLAAAGMLLACPVVWDHYLTVLLILVVALVAVTRRPAFGLTGMGLVSATLLGGLSMVWLPALALWALAKGGPKTVASTTVSRDPVLSSAS